MARKSKKNEVVSVEAQVAVEAVEATEVAANPFDQAEFVPEVVEATEPVEKPSLLSRFGAVREMPGRKSASVKSKKSKRVLPIVDVKSLTYCVSVPVSREFELDGWHVQGTRADSIGCKGAADTGYLADLADKLEADGLAVLDGMVRIYVERPAGMEAEDWQRLSSLCSNHRTALEAFGAYAVLDTRGMSDADAEKAMRVGHNFVKLTEHEVIFQFDVERPSLQTLPLDLASLLQLCLGLLAKCVTQRANYGFDSDPVYRSSKHLNNPSYTPYHDDGTPLEAAKRLIDARLHWGDKKKIGSHFGILDDQFSGLCRQQLLAMAAAKMKPVEVAPIDGEKVAS
jgi:hypothetical protein